MIVEIVRALMVNELTESSHSFLTSRSVASGLVERGAVHVDGGVETSGKVRLVEGQEVSVDPSQVPGETLPEADHTVEVSVVHVDEHVIVVDKHAGWSFTRVQEMTRRRLLTAYAEFPEIASVGEPHRPGIVHRLDAGSTGLLVVAQPNMRTTNLFQAEFTRQHACIRFVGGIQLRCMV